MRFTFLLGAVLALCGCATADDAIAAGKPLAISLSPAAQTVTEGARATLTIGKTGGNGRPSQVRITTSDGSFAATVAVGAQISVPTVDDSIVNGTRSITVTGTASTGAPARATITILDNDVAPPPPPPAANPTYGDVVTALKACTGKYIPDALTAGQSYKVVGLWASFPEGTGTGPGSPGGVILNPVDDDGIHRGDGYVGLWVEYACVGRTASVARGAFVASAAPTNPIDKRLKFGRLNPIKVASRTCFNALDTQGHGNEFITIKGRSYYVRRSANAEMVFVRPVKGKQTETTPLVMRSCLAS